MAERRPPPCGSRTWTAAETQYLEEKWGNVSIPYIAKKLNRTVSAIKIKAQKLGLGAVLMSGSYISLNALMQAVTGHNVQTYQLKSWIENRDLPVHTRRVEKNSFRVVYLDEFWEWAEKNRSFIDFSKMKPFALGVEPDWVKEQRAKDFQGHSLQRKDPWTAAEDERLLFLLKQQKYGYKELSEKLCRSEGAIQRRCQDLGTKYRPVKADNHGPESVWTAEDFEVLANGIRAGDGYAAISARIGKSEKAIRGKVYFTYLTESADKVRAMLGDGKWGDGAPVPTVKQGLSLSRTRTALKKDLAALVSVLRYRMNELGFEPYWQRFMCMHWDDFKGCTAGETDCDTCTSFRRIREQYCARCGGTFLEREENRFCEKCRTARKKQARKKWCILNKRHNERMIENE